MATDNITRTFEETEKKGEVFAALARVIIAIVILLAAWTSRDAGNAGHPLIIIAVLYGFMSLIGVVLAFGKVFHLLIPYAFVAIDMAVIAFALTMLAHMHNLSLSHEFSLPLFSLSFVILIHTALRYRPLLILFGFSLFVILLFALPIMMSLPLMSQSSASPSSSHILANPLELALHDVGFLPLLFLTLATALLFYIVMRTRSMTELALNDGRRASQLSRFFSPEVADSLGSAEADIAQSGTRLKVAVIFIDIRGFSKLAENLNPEEVVEFLSAFRTEVCEIVFKHGGTVDKFIGDAVLVVFGAPVAHIDNATRALKASIEIQDKINNWCLCRKHEQLPYAKIGIGGHYGEVFSGIIESGQILEHSIIGDTVNIAERLERKTRELNADFVFSDDLIAEADLLPHLTQFQSLDNVEIRGHKYLLKIWYK